MKDFVLSEKTKGMKEDFSDYEFDSSSILMVLAVYHKDYQDLTKFLPQLFSIGRRIDYDGLSIHVWFRNSVHIPSQEELQKLTDNLPLNHNFIYAGNSLREVHSSVSVRSKYSYQNQDKQIPNKNLLGMFKVVPMIQVTDVIKDALKETEKEGDVCVHVTVS